ncbi:hypothetical protein [Palleronia aestuarii]|nr:hypothetical protein [Palleronia aestuarii]
MRQATRARTDLETVTAADIDAARAIVLAGDTPTAREGATA